MEEKKFEGMVGSLVERILVSGAPSVGRMVTAMLTAVVSAANSKYFLDFVRTSRIGYANLWRTMRAATESFRDSGGLVAVLEFVQAVRDVRQQFRDAVPSAERTQLLMDFAAKFPVEGLRREMAKWEEEEKKSAAFLADPFGLRPRPHAPAEVPTPDEIN